MARALIDNDVVIKISVYGFGAVLTDTTTLDGMPPAMLSVGRFVVRDRLKRARQLADQVGALAHFEALLPELLLLEPTNEELALAADFEAAATAANFELDGGESQLLAILLLRTAAVLITGDKRAIRAIGSIAIESIKGRVACFEQLMTTILARVGHEAVRNAVCSEPSADKALAICFSCWSGGLPAAEEILAAIESYTNDVRKHAAGTLVCDRDLSALAT